ncbi:putative peptidase family-domain-containing protein [Xylariaceae sp. AK1471]|nr:putative peptidase family-domain-containing protein [Xylariaceae sp. AK1471]
MAPRFNLKQIRRRSLASFRTERTERSTDTSSNDDPSSNQEQSSVGSITPPSLANESDPALPAQIPIETRRPPEPNSNRYSVAESIASEAPPTKDQQGQSHNQQPLSPYAPQVTNIRHGTTVYQKVLLVTGTVGQDRPPHRPVDGTLFVSRLDKAVPLAKWPVYGGRFKALIHLLPGPNTISFEFQKPGLSTSADHSSIVIHMFEPKIAPPLQLAILVAKDSPLTFDSVPARLGSEGNNIEVAIRKFRMAAYLWQSFTAEQMARSGLGRCTFRFDEEWTTGTSYDDDLSEHVMRSEARVHVVRTDKTVAEIRDLERAQENPKATKKDELFDITAAALRDYFRIKPGQKQYVATLILDSHWDTKEKIIAGHAAKGGQAGIDLDLAIFGSHCLQSYPSTICEVLPAFKDCTPTNTDFVANPANEAGYSWEAAVRGIGAHLHEIGHLLGSPHQESGIMARDYLTFNRTFMVNEAYSTRTKSKGGPIQPEDEPAWHRLDLLRFRFHLLFRIPNNKPPNPDKTVHGWTVENQNVLVTAGSGLLCTEIFAEGDEVCRTWIEYPRRITRNMTLSEVELRSRLPEEKRRSKMKVIVRSLGGGELVMDDFHHLCTKSTIKLTSGPMGKSAFRSTKIGFSQMKGSEPQEVIFSSAATSINRIQTSVTVHHGTATAIHGLEFHYDNGSSQLFGKRDGISEKFMLDIRNAEVIVGFAVRAGLWIDAIQIITSTSRRSPFYGNVNGGSLHTLFVPSGFKICGVAGTYADWLDGFSVIITR